MTRLKKLFATMLLVFVTVCSVLGSAVLNIARTIFTSSSAKADVATIPGNINDTNAVKAGDVVSIPGFDTKVEKGESILLPMSAVKVGGNQITNFKNLFVEVTDIYGQALTQYDTDEGTQVATIGSSQVIIETDADSGEKVLALSPSKAGIYQVKYYVLSNGVWTSTDVYQITVAEDSYKMTFATNDATVMPSTFNYTTTQTINVALPLLYDEEGTLIENEDILLGGVYGAGEDAYYYLLKYEDVAGENGVTLSAVSKINNTKNLYTEYKTYTVRKVSAVPATVRYALKVDLQSSNLVMNNYDATKRFNLSGVTTDASVYDLNPFSFEVSSTLGGGDYVLTYSMYNVSNGTPAATPIKNVQWTMVGDSEFKQSDISVYAKTSSNIKRSEVSFKEKKYLPSVNAANSSDASTTVEAFYYYTIGVQSGDDVISTKEYVTMGHDENGFYFVPNNKGGTYEIGYEVVDAFGNSSVNSSSDNYYTVQIFDDSNPVVVYSKAFDAEDVDQTSPAELENLVKSGEIEDISYVVPAKYTLSTDETTRTIRIPAIAAADYSGLREVTRTLSSTSYIVDAQGTKASSTQYLTITSNTGRPSAPANVSHVALRDYLMFEDVDGNLIDAEGYLINASRQYLDVSGATVTDANKVFAFKDEEGHDLTGTKLRDAFNACEAIVTLRNDVFAAGTYTLTMRAQEEGNKYNSNRDTTITLYADDDITPTTPTVTYTESKVADVVKDQTVYVLAPTVKDTTDTNLLVKYYVDVEGAQELIEVKLDEDGKYISFNTSTAKDSTGKSVFELAADSSTKSFDVVTFALSDFAKSERELISAVSGATNLSEALASYSEDDDTFAYIGRGAYTVSVKDYSSDSIPIIEELPEYTAMAVPVQYSEYEVSGFKFKDDTDTAEVEITVTDTKGNSYEYSTLGAMSIVASNGEYVYTFPGIKFYPDNADSDNNYTVTYRIKDGASNVVNYSFVLVHATDKDAPVISGLVGSSATLELGEVYKFNIKATDNTVTASSIVFRATVVNEEGKDVSNWFNPSRLTFSPREAGTYTVSIRAYDGDPDDVDTNISEEKVFTVNVVDTLKPVVEYVVLENGMSDTILVRESQITTENANTTYPTVKLPTVSGTDQWSANKVDGLVKDTTEVTVTVSAPSTDANSVKEYTFDKQGNIQNGVENTLNFVKTGDFFYFTPTTRGAYTVTYSAKDAAGNEAVSKVITVKVGDTEKPTVELTNAFAKLLENGFVIGSNDTLAINNNAIVVDSTKTVDYESLCQIKVSDNYGFNSNTDEDMHVELVEVRTSITNSNGTTVQPTESEDSLIHYTFTTSGTYTLTLTVSDKIGNQRVFTKQFYVTTKEATQSNASTVVGIVLIAVSAVVLAGVIVYFVRGTKMLPKKKNQKPTNNKKED